MEYRKDPLYQGIKQAILDGSIVPIKQEYTGVASGLNAFLHENSAMRAAMYGGHLSQHLVINGCQPPRISTGIEFEYGEYTWSVAFDKQARIVAIIPRFAQNFTADGIAVNTMNYVLYENLSDPRKPELRLLEVPEHHIMHQQYGFKYRATDAYRRLERNQLLPAGTRLMESPSIDPNTREWGYGRNCMVCFGSFYPCIEDGGVARRGVLKNFISEGIEKRTITSGASRFPINLYHREGRYQALPENGECIRSDGLLCATREIDLMLCIVDMQTENLKRPDYVYDDLTYAEPNARVSDIDAVSDRNRRGSRGARTKQSGINDLLKPPYRQFLKYEHALSTLYTSIRAEVKKHTKERSEAVVNHHGSVMTYLNLADAELGIQTRTASGGLKMTYPSRGYRKEALDDWRVTVTYTYPVEPGIGFKFTGNAGDKFVITDIMEDDEMPVDEWGNVADFMFSDDTVIKRMSLSRINTPYINSTADQIMRELKPKIDAREDLEGIWNTIMRFHYIISPEMVEKVIEPLVHTDEDKWDYILYIQKHGISLVVPTDSIAAGSGRMLNMIREFPLKIGPIKYRGRSGLWRTTKSPMLIGSTYIMKLEKTSSTWSAVGVPKLQAHGLPAKLGKSDKFSSPGKEQPTRYCGEAEFRAIYALMGGWVASVFMEYANNPQMLDRIVEAVYATPTPTNIESSIDLDITPLGGNRALQIINHQLAVAGVRIIDAEDAGRT